MIHGVSLVRISRIRNRHVLLRHQIVSLSKARAQLGFEGRAHRSDDTEFSSPCQVRTSAAKWDIALSKPTFSAASPDSASVRLAPRPSCRGLLCLAFNGSNAFRRTGVKAVMVAVQKPGWQVSDQADHSTSKAGHSTHPGQPAGQESQVAQDGPQTSPAASSAQQETSTETPSVSASKTSVPTNPAGKQDSEPPAEFNAARTNPSGRGLTPFVRSTQGAVPAKGVCPPLFPHSAEQDKERPNGSEKGTGSNQDDSCLSPFFNSPIRRSHHA